MRTMFTGIATAAVAMITIAVLMNGQAPSIDADTSTYRHPFRVGLYEDGRLVRMVYAYWQGDTFAYSAYADGQLLHTVFQRGSECFMALPGEARAAVSDCVVFFVYHRAAIPGWTIELFKLRRQPSPTTPDRKRARPKPDLEKDDERSV